MKKATIATLGASFIGLTAGIAAGYYTLSTRYSFLRKVVVITGGSRGLGLLLARRFAQEGAKLAIIARLDSELEQAQRDLRALGAEALTVSCDVTCQSEVIEAINRIGAHYGQIDVLVNNAGLIQVGPMENMAVADYENAMAVHFYGPLYTTLAALPYLRRSGDARIVNISSIGGKVSVPHMAPYTASKFALTGFSGACTAELRKDNIFVTTVCPAPMRTGSPRNAEFKGNFRSEYAWFAVADSIPLLSVSGERAAAKIVAACRRGAPRIVLGLQAKIAVLMNELFPDVMAFLLAGTNRLMPAVNRTAGTESHLGRDSESTLTRSPVLALTRRAALRNNEDLRAA